MKSQNDSFEARSMGLSQSTARPANGHAVPSAGQAAPSSGGEPNWNPYREGTVAAVYPYTDEAGTLLYERVRIVPPAALPRPNPRKAIRPRVHAPGDPKAVGGYVWGQGGHPPLLYRLPDLARAVTSGERVFIVEGEKDVETLRAWGLVATFKPSGWSEKDAEHFRGTSAVVIPDNDEAGRKKANQAIEVLHAAGIIVQVLTLPGLGTKGDVTDWAALGPLNDRTTLEQLAASAPRYAPPPPEKKGPLSKPDALARLADRAELFRTPDGEAFARVPDVAQSEGGAPVSGGAEHWETHPLRSSAFAGWLEFQYWKANSRAAGQNAIQETIDLLSARARYEGGVRPVFLRVGHAEETEYDAAGTPHPHTVLYVDLGSESWEAVRIDASGWQIVADPPVAFRRTSGMGELPRPTRPGNLELLRRHTGIEEDDQFALLLAFIVGSYHPDGPYPLLNLVGEQGAGKSFKSQIVRSLIDPSQVPTRSEPRSEQDLVIGAKNSHVLCFDNLSGIAPWLSDALCRISTGGGFGTRRLHTNDEEVLFYGKRPAILNGIDDIATRPDLAQRSITITLPAIPKRKRVPESVLVPAMDADRPAILGGIFDALSAALRYQAGITGPFPRMADFARWAMAAERAFPVEQGTFRRAYDEVQTAAVHLGIENDVVASGIVAFIASGGPWEGTTAELLGELRDRLPSSDKPPRGFPTSPQSMTKRLRRIAPLLREVGIEREDLPREAGTGTRRFKLTDPKEA
jgi:hypothetical protein